MQFACHAHVHDEYSPLDGTGTRNQLTHQAARKGQSHLGITNHGRLGGVLEHIHACRSPEEYDDPTDPAKKRSKDERLIPILGIEAFWRPDRFMDLSDKDKYGKSGHTWAQHLCLHAADMTGWRTLMRLSSKSWVRREEGGGYYGKPCMDWDMLEADNEGILISTACLSSPLAQLILAEDEQGATRWLRRAIAAVGSERVFLEIMPHDLPEQRTINIAKINLANQLGLPFMVTGDVHMPYKKWATTHSIVRMASYRTTISKQDKKREAGEDTYTENIDTVYLSSGKELKSMFDVYHPDIPSSVVDEALANTAEFTKRFKWYVIGKSTKLPQVKVDAVKAVRQWVDDGLARLRESYPESHWERYPYSTYQERVEMEWKVLVEKGVVPYFYITGDFVRWAKTDLPLPKYLRDGTMIYFGPKKKPIRVGLGRGSAAGCMISYLIGITAIDPIPHRLLFERFMNPDRVGMPDIDIDFASGADGRELVKEYLRIVYGYDHVADIIAYQTFAPRSVIKAVADTQDFDFRTTKNVTDSIGDLERDLEQIAATNEVVHEFKEGNPKIWKHCLRLEDQILRDTKHAGGVLITPRPTTYYMPTQIGNDERSVVTAWSDRAEFPIVSDYGFVKWDILGVNSLNKQQYAVDLIREHYGDEVEPNQLPALRNPYESDPATIEGFVKGLTVGVFQFSGRGITQLLRHIKPDTVTDISVANALYRPGPIKIAFEYGDRKQGKVPVTYWHDSLEPLLSETLGLIAFQEQVMEIVKALGGFTGGQADSMRKAISKLYRLPGGEARKFMQQYFDQWMQGCRDNGIRDTDAQEIWERILEFAGYGFNRCVTGDTQVIRSSGNQYQPSETTIADLYEAWNSKTPVGKKYRSQGVRILQMSEDGRVRPERCVGVHYQGSKPVYKITTDSGNSIKVTSNHRMLMADGSYQRCDELEIGDYLVADVGEYEETIREYVANKYSGVATHAGIQGWGVGKDNVAYIDGRKVALDQAREVVRQRADGACERCGRRVQTKKHALEFAHLHSLEECDEDYSEYNSPGNIEHLCNSCHKRLDWAKGERVVRWKKGRPTYYDEIVHIEYVGEAPVYDLEMDTPDHNFIANGLVSHNSHSSSYGLQAYQDMWLKVTYPLAFYASVLTLEHKSNRDDQTAFLKNALRETQAFDIEADPPDVNRSDRGWTIDNERLRYGLVSINGIGEAAANEVIKHKPYKSFAKFQQKLPSGFGTGSYLALAKAGAFDGLEERVFLLGKTPKWDTSTIAKFSIEMTCGHKKTKTVKTKPGEELEDQIMQAMAALECKHHPDARIKEAKRDEAMQPVVQWLKEHPRQVPEPVTAPDQRELVALEEEALYVPMTLTSQAHQYNEFIERKIYTEQEFDELPAKPQRQGKKHGRYCSCKACASAAVVVGGEVTNISTTKTKKDKEEMAFVDFAFGANQYSCTLFPAIWREFQGTLRNGTLFLVSGHKDDFRDPPSIIVNEIVDVYELAEAENFTPNGKTKTRKQLASAR